MGAPWLRAMVERHGVVMAEIFYIILSEARAVGPDPVRAVLRFASLAKHRRPVRTGYSPRALIYGLDERLITRGLDHDVEQPNGAATT